MPKKRLGDKRIALAPGRETIGLRGPSRIGQSLEKHRGGTAPAQTNDNSPACPDLETVDFAT